MPEYGWKPEYNLPPQKRREWPPPPDTSAHRSLKRSQLVKKSIPPKPQELTEEEQRILYEREIYRLYSLHAAPEELLKQYEEYRDEKVTAGTVRAWLMHSYQGEVDENNLPDGIGEANMAGGMHYNGSFMKGLLHGKGRLEWDNGSSYEGNFYCNRMNGRGVCVYNWAEGAKYTGQIHDGVPHGQGKIEGPGGLIYEGRWEHGKRQGLVAIRSLTFLPVFPGVMGRMTYGTESTYEGYWKNDRKDGQGQLLYTTGSSYDGLWLDGKRHWRGRQVQRIIPIKEKGGKGAIACHALAMQGTPVTVYAHIYEGDWFRGLPHGSGRSEWLWDGKKTDASILINSYSGSYKEGQRFGYGSFFYASGALFKGCWLDNMKAGLGVLVYETGKVHFGTFSHDRYDPLPPKPEFDMVVPLVSTVKYLKEENIEEAKHGILRTIMRYKNDIQDAFLYYCCSTEASKASLLSNPFKTSSLEARVGQKSKGIKSAKIEKEGSAPKESVKKPNEPTEKLVNKGKKDTKEEKKGKSGLKPSEPEVEGPPFKPMKQVTPEPQSPRQKVPGRSRGISNTQFWLLLQDAHVLQPGLGLADVDRMLPTNQFSWDTVSDIHSASRQLILREVIVALVQIALCKYQHEKISSEDKVEKLFSSMFEEMATLSFKSWFRKVESTPVQVVLLENMNNLLRQFGGLILESATPDFTISLGSLIKYGQNRRPGYDVPPGTLLAKVLQELYHYQMKPEETVSTVMEHNINFQEFEVVLLIFASLGEDVESMNKEGAMDVLGGLLKGFLDGSTGKGNKVDKVQKVKGGKPELKTEKKRKDNPEWVN